MDETSKNLTSEAGMIVLVWMKNISIVSSIWENQYRVGQLLFIWP